MNAQLYRSQWLREGFVPEVTSYENFIPFDTISEPRNVIVGSGSEVGGAATVISGMISSSVISVSAGMSFFLSIYGSL